MLVDLTSEEREVIQELIDERLKGYYCEEDEYTKEIAILESINSKI